MTLLALYPGVASSRAAEFKVIALGDGPTPELQHGAIKLNTKWDKVTLDNGAIVQVGTAVAADLLPDTEIAVAAFESGAEIDRAIVRTLPNELGPNGSDLRLFLASCYCRLNPSSRRAHELFGDLFRAYGTPHLKLWCGDQVYLDSPATSFLTKWNHSSQELAESHLTHYTRTWSRDHLALAMARGANAFAPDDHEYWNNAPYPNVVVPGLYDKKRRAHWTRIAGQLLWIFQKVFTAPIVVPPISILMLDTRSSRTPSGSRREFMTAADLSRLDGWVKSLANTGPGLLVLGQPLFHSASDRWFSPRVLEDYSLADFDQFVHVLRILDRAARDIVILTGDVHFTRAAHMTLPSGRQIVEIVNSPLALVIGLPRATPSDAQGFAKFPGAGSISAGILKTDTAFRSNEDSAIALSFHRHGLRVRMRVELWCVTDSPGAVRTKIPAYEHDLF